MSADEFTYGLRPSRLAWVWAACGIAAYAVVFLPTSVAGAALQTLINGWRAGREDAAPDADTTGGG